MTGVDIDADQRITRDVEKLTNDLAGLVTGMVKPSVDILWSVLCGLMCCSGVLWLIRLS